MTDYLLTWGFFTFGGGLNRVTCFACSRRLGLRSSLGTVSQVPFSLLYVVGLCSGCAEHRAQQAAQGLAAPGRDLGRWASVRGEQAPRVVIQRGKREGLIHLSLCFDTQSSPPLAW